MSKIKDIEEYYDEKTSVYLKIYGDVIQAFRPKSNSKLLSYLRSSIGLKRGQKIIDAGCGVAGPAIYFATKTGVYIDGVTLSDVQVRTAEEKIKAKRVSSKVKVVKGDYHELSTIYTTSDYDGAIFLESLGHAENPTKVIREAAQLIKIGGFIYVKDFFKKESENGEFQDKVDTIIGRMNDNYCYNTLRLTPLIETIRALDFEIDFIKKFDFKDDTSIRAAFENDQNIDIFNGYEEFWPAEWLEIRCVKIS